MDYEDRLTVATPEGVTVEVALAGLGSRMAAGIVDGVIQLLLIGAWLALLAIIGAAMGDGGGAATTQMIAALVWIILPVATFFGYGILFETLWNGRTPGKRLTGIRVIRTGGRPIGFRASVIRNLLRIIDVLPSLYLIGSISILVNSRNQRLGDILAGTVVVRDRAAAPAVPGPTVAPEERAGLELWDVGGVTYDDLVTVRQFLARREKLTPEARNRLATDLERRLRPKVQGAPSGQSAEGFLERLAAAKTAKQ